MRETWVQFLGQEDPLEKEMATHSSILAWKTPWTEKPDRLQSVGSQSQTRLSNFTFSFLFPDGGRPMVWSKRGQKAPLLLGAKPA